MNRIIKNMRVKRTISLICIIGTLLTGILSVSMITNASANTHAVSLENVSEDVLPESTSSPRVNVEISQYYPDQNNKKDYFSYFILEDKAVKGYNCLVITEFSEGFGKKLELPDEISGKMITDVVLMHIDVVEELKLGRNTINLFCSLPTVNYDGTPGRYMDDVQNQRNYMGLDYYELPEGYEEIKCTIKKLIVGKHFQIDSLFEKGWWRDTWMHIKETVGIDSVFPWDTEWGYAEFSNLEEIVTPDGNGNFIEESGYIYSGNGKKLLYALKPELQKATKFVTRENVTEICADFSGADNLEEVIIGDDVKIVGGDFGACKKLTKLSLGNNVEEIKENTFSNAPLTGELIFPKSLKKIGRWAFLGTKIEKVSFENCPDFVFGTDMTFYSCENLKTVILPDNLVVVPEETFALCESLEKITLPKKTKVIGADAFYGCKKLTKVSIKKGLKKVGKEAFGFCNSLVSVTFPKGMKEIGKQVFAKCKKLKRVTIKGKKTKLKRMSIVVDDNISKFSVNKKITIYAPKGSFAQKYAKKNKIKFKVLK